MPDWLQILVQGVLTVVALVAIVIVLAGLFMIVFGIATGIDDRIQQ